MGISGVSPGNCLLASPFGRSGACIEITEIVLVHQHKSQSWAEKKVSVQTNSNATHSDVVPL